jgi:hypothetical protein
MFFLIEHIKFVKPFFALERKIPEIVTVLVRVLAVHCIEQTVGIINQKKSVYGYTRFRKNRPTAGRKGLGCGFDSL